MNKLQAENPDENAEIYFKSFQGKHYTSMLLNFGISGTYIWNAMFMLKFQSFSSVKFRMMIMYLSLNSPQQ